MLIHKDFLMIVLFYSVLFLFVLFFLEYITKLKMKSKDRLSHDIYKTTGCIEIIIDQVLPLEKKTNLETIDYIIFLSGKIYCVKYVDFIGYVYGRDITKVWWCVSSTKKKIENPMEIAYEQSKYLKNIIGNKIDVIPIVLFPDETNIDYVDCSSNQIEILKVNKFIEILNCHSNYFNRKEKRKIKKLIIDVELNIN